MNVHLTSKIAPIHRLFAAASRVVLGVAAFLLLGISAPLSRGVERWLTSADQAAEQRHYATAQQGYHHVLARAGAAPALFERLVRVSVDAGDDGAARVYLYALVDRDGWTAARRETLHDILERSGDTAGAAALFYATLASDENDPNTLRQLAQQQITRQDWIGLSDTLSRLYVVVPTDPQVLYWMGVLLAVDDPVLASTYLDLAAMDPDWAVAAVTVRDALDAYTQRPLTEAHTVLGVALAGLGEWEFAERALVRAIDINAVNPLALGYLGFVRDQQGRDGLPDIEAALAMSPNDPQLHYLMGLHWRLVGDQAAAYDAFMRAFAFDATNPALAAEIATSLHYLSDLAGAERWYNEAIRLDPDAIRWQRALAAFYADTGFRLDDVGFDFIERTSARAPNDPDITASLGWAYYQRYDNQSAYETLNRAMAQDSTLPRVRYYFGVVLERLGDSQGAADSYWYVVDRYGTESRYGALAARALQRLGYPLP